MNISKMLTKWENTVRRSHTACIVSYWNTDFTILDWWMNDWSEVHELWWGVMRGALEAGRPALKPKKVFIPKHPLPTLHSYAGKANRDFWETFPSNHKWPGDSLIDADALEELGVSLGLLDDRFHTVLNDIRYGASLGCRGEARLPTRSKNSPSAHEFGAQVSDAIADWVVKGFAHGPVKPRDLPKSAKVAGMMCRLKPNGSVRIIQNLSSPKGRSVNDGIDKREFPAIMSSTRLFVTVLNKGGRGSLMVKTDWSDAYKHIAVCVGDLNLQWFQWLGMYFCELDLIFGGVSSVGIYDRAAKVVNSVVLKLAGMPADMVCQHLDDTCAAAPADSGLAERFDETYQMVAKKIGVKLAPRDDPEKSFGPSTEGIVLGVRYNTKDWTWAIPEDRLGNIVNLLLDVMIMEEIPSATMETLVGKIVHVKPLIPGGKFHISELQRAIGDIRREEIRQKEAGVSSPIYVRMTSLLEAQLMYWRVLLPACSGRVPIPDLNVGVAPWTIEFYTDAAGGSLSKKGQGVGAVGPSWWAYMAWPRSVNIRKRRLDGVWLGGKMALLELLGPLVVIAAGYRICGGKDIRIWVDNNSSVVIFQKGYSPVCGYSTCVVRAINVVASRIACRVTVAEITRCSTREAVAADALSKAHFGRFLSCWEGPLPDGARAPVAILRWLHAGADPLAPLGEMILKELGL